MESSDVFQLVKQIIAIDLAVADTQSCRGVLQGLARLISWAESRQIDVVGRLEQIAALQPEVSPEHVVADATRVSLGEALVAFQRAETVGELPEFAASLASGAVSSAHIDVLTHAIGRLDEVERRRFAGREAFLAEVAQRSTPKEFARTVRAEALRSQRHDGIERLLHQKKATFLKTWVDQASGMFCLRGEFDPETGARLSGRLSATIEKLFHDATPDTAPKDPLAKQQHLAALALVALSEGNGSKPRGDLTILIDSKTLVDGLHEHTVVDCGLPIELPVETIRRMACISEINPVIVGADGVKLYLGQSTRLASPEQRRALRVMYRTCAVPGCCVAWDNVVIHHLRYYRNKGPTNIDNLVPLCVKHHHFAHEGGWKFSLGSDRTLTIVRPDGSTSIHAPPRALAA
jgi:hypothetical protein